MQYTKVTQTAVRRRLYGPTVVRGRANNGRLMQAICQKTALSAFIGTAKRGGRGRAAGVIGPATRSLAHFTARRRPISVSSLLFCRVTAVLLPIRGRDLGLQVPSQRLARPLPSAGVGEKETPLSALCSVRSSIFASALRCTATVTGAKEQASRGLPAISFFYFVEETDVCLRWSVSGVGERGGLLPPGSICLTASTVTAASKKGQLLFRGQPLFSRDWQVTTRGNCGGRVDGRVTRFWGAVFCRWLKRRITCPFRATPN